MFRLLKLRKLPSCNSQTVSCTVKGNFFTRTCAFCNHNFVLKAPKDSSVCSSMGSMRMQSTNTKTLMQGLQKKKKRKLKKKYAELLEVTNASSSQKKASVSKLTPKHLSLLAEQPDINLNELFQLKKLKSHSSDGVDIREKTQQIAFLFIPPEMNPECINTENILKSTPPELYKKSELQEGVFSENLLPIKSKNVSEYVPDSNYRPIVSCENFELSSNVEPAQVNLLSVPDRIAQELDLSIDDPELRRNLLEDVNNIAANNSSAFKDDLLEEHFDFHETDVDNTHSSVEQQEKKKKGNRKKEKKGLLAKEQASRLKRIEMEQNGRSETLTRGLSSYMDVCVSSGLLNRAQSTLNYYRSRRRIENPYPKLNDNRPYNVLLRGFAAKGLLTKLKDVLRMMEEDEVQWSLQTYAAAFECVGRLPSSSANIALLKTWLCTLQNSGWVPNDIFEKNKFLADQREMALKAMQLILPSFEPRYPEPDSCYSCELLQELNKSEKRKTYKSPMQGVHSKINLKAASKEQFAIENCDHIKVKSIEERKEISESTKYYREKLSEMEAEWRNVLSRAFEREIEVLRAQSKCYSNQTQINLYPYLHILDSTVYVDLLLKEIRRLAEGSETFSPTTHFLYRQLGTQVMLKYEVEYKRSLGVLDQIERMYGKYCDWFANPSGTACNPREQWQQLLYENSNGPNVDVEKKDWSSLVLTGIGKFLYNIILRDIKIDINIMKPNSKNKHLLPAFYTLFRNHGRVIKEEVKPHPALARLFRSACLEDLIFDVNLIPMLSPPIPWTNASSGIGGYVLNQADLVRLPFLAYQQKMRMENAPPRQLYPSLDALNQLGSIPWVVNEPMLDVVIKVFNKGGSPRLDIPQPPSACPQPSPVTPDMTREQRIKAFQERIALRRRKAEMYSLWCDTLYRLSLANHFRKHVFWLPHNMDFRGRVYPCPPHLNHLGSDMPRSLLQFAQQQPLGSKGLDWLMIHLINLTGLMKRDPVKERLLYARSIVPDIMDSADHPLTGKMWWATNEEPWQVLATCMEITRAIRSGNPETYMSGFPVHQDGSCNGLQHYAALGRDAVGAESVNLTPASSPQDVYSCVAALVERERVKDAAEGNKIAQILDGFVRRKVIKQTVMTTVYGVTRYGARLQIARQLKDIDEFPKEHVWHGSSYLVMKTFDSLREMFTSTKEIQDWFTDCAKQIAQSCGQNVEWVTPLGLPVVQPYVRFTRRSDCRNKSQKLNEHFTMDMYERPNVMKQKNALPPNFIHSLDSSHMMLTSLLCEREGITFVSVHDCYWTHPCTIDIMNKICREQFVALHSQPILENLSQFLLKKFCSKESTDVVPISLRDLNKLLKNVPKTGDFDLTKVLKSVYFFS